MQYDEMYLTFTAGSGCLCVVMWSSLSVCKVVLVAYVDTVVVMTVMHVLLFLLDVCMLSECKGEDGDDNAGVGEGEAWLN